MIFALIAAPACKNNTDGGEQTTNIRIAALKGDYKLFPGHGEASTLSHERKNNPYLFFSL